MSEWKRQRRTEYTHPIPQLSVNEIPNEVWGHSNTSCCSARYKYTLGCCWGNAICWSKQTLSIYNIEQLVKQTFKIYIMSIWCHTELLFGTKVFRIWKLQFSPRITIAFYFEFNSKHNYQIDEMITLYTQHPHPYTTSPPYFGSYKGS